MAEREKAEDVLVEQHFSDTSQQASKKMRKLEKPFFKTQKHNTKQEK